MKILISIGLYIFISILIYFVMQAKCKKDPVFKAPKHRWTYYALSLTWGLPMTLFGAIVAFALIITGHRPKRYGWDWCFEFKNLGWGLELGLFFIAPTNSELTNQHEHGHGIQNIYFGIFTPAVVSIPSAIRFWYREIRYNIGKPCKTKYDDIWFEGSATASGKAFIDSLGAKNERK